MGMRLSTDWIYKPDALSRRPSLDGANAEALSKLRVDRLRAHYEHGQGYREAVDRMSEMANAGRTEDVIANDLGWEIDELRRIARREGVQIQPRQKRKRTLYKNSKRAVQLWVTKKTDSQS